MKSIEQALSRLEEHARESERVLGTPSPDLDLIEEARAELAALSPPDDESIGDVVAAYADGSVVLDDGILVHSYRRACQFLAQLTKHEAETHLRECLRMIAAEMRALRPECAGDSYITVPRLFLMAIGAHLRMAGFDPDSKPYAALRAEKCEGCGSPATHYDNLEDLIPLCRPCWESLLTDEARAALRSGGKGDKP